jgi:hypothetical protein
VQEVREVQAVQLVPRSRCVAAIFFLLVPATVLAQATAQQNVEVDPVQCWWRTSTAAVRVGETFEIHLTCSALETDAATAVIDRTRLGSAAVQFPPFEVVGGTQSADHVTPGRRFMQYHYSLRLIAEDFFGSDIVIPAMAISYRIESRVQSDAALQGREQEYEMPALTMRINALVASDARHIREAAVPSLDDIAAREFRARMFRLVATILFALSGLLLAIAVLGWIRRQRAAHLGPVRHFLPARTVLARVRRELRDVHEQTRGVGWNPAALSRALAAARIAGGYLVGRPITQKEAADATGGELGIVRGGFGRKRVAVSATASSHALALDGRVADLNDAIRTLTAARYGRTEDYDNAALDDALAAAERAAARAAGEHTWIAETTRAIAHTVRGWTPRPWAR